MVRIAVLVSGGGTNLQALIDAECRGEIPGGRLTLCIASNPDAYALTRAQKHKIKTAVVRLRDYPDRATYSAALLKTLRDERIELVILAGFLTILPVEVIEGYRDRIINVHPSLIPSFCGEGFYGLRVHQAALDYGVKVTGATVHLVSEVVDGGRILFQKAVEVEEGDTPETLQRRVMQEAEWKLLPRAAALLCHEIQTEKERDESMQNELSKLLRENSYPGRGIVLGRSNDGKNAVIAYFIMGRSENSRNRIFVLDGEGLRTEAYDPSKLTDPSLIIYAPVRVYRDDATAVTIVTNGDQTDTVYDGFSNGMSFSDALRQRTFEPDAPNYTPRISGAVEGFGYLLSILKSADGDPASVRRYYFEYPQPVAGQGHFIHTYHCDGNPLPSFEGEPEQVAIEGDIDSFTGMVWDSLDASNRVSLFVRFIEVETGKTETRIINRHN